MKKKMNLKPVMKKVVVSTMLAAVFASALGTVTYAENKKVNYAEMKEKLEKAELDVGIKKARPEEPRLTNEWYDGILYSDDYSIYWDGYGFELMWFDDEGNQEDSAYVDENGKVIIERGRYSSIRCDGYGYQVSKMMLSGYGWIMTSNGYVGPDGDCVADLSDRQWGFECFGDHIIYCGDSGQYGLMDLHGNIVADAVFDLIECEEKDGKFEYALYTRENSYTLDDLKTEEVENKYAYTWPEIYNAPFDTSEYSSVMWDGHGYVLTIENEESYLNKVGYADENGNILIPADEYNQIYYDGYGYVVEKLLDVDQYGFYANDRGYLDDELNVVLDCGEYSDIKRIDGEKLLVVDYDKNYEIMDLNITMDKSV